MKKLRLDPDVIAVTGFEVSPSGALVGGTAQQAFAATRITECRQDTCWTTCVDNLC